MSRIEWLVTAKSANAGRSILNTGALKGENCPKPGNRERPRPHVPKEFLGEIDTTTPYVIGKIVSRLEMDSRWALARSVRALVAERNALKEKLEATQVSKPI